MIVSQVQGQHRTAPRGIQVKFDGAANDPSHLHPLAFRQAIQLKSARARQGGGHSLRVPAILAHTTLRSDPRHSAASWGELACHAFYTQLFTLWILLTEFEHNKNKVADQSDGRALDHKLVAVCRV
jgi:hypothetical protein